MSQVKSFVLGENNSLSHLSLIEHQIMQLLGLYDQFLKKIWTELDARNELSQEKDRLQSLSECNEKLSPLFFELIGCIFNKLQQRLSQKETEINQLNDQLHCLRNQLDSCQAQKDNLLNTLRFT